MTALGAILFILAIIFMVAALAIAGDRNLQELAIALTIVGAGCFIAAMPVFIYGVTHTSSYRENQFRSNCVQTDHGQIKVTQSFDTKSGNLTGHDTVTCYLPDGQTVTRSY